MRGVLDVDRPAVQLEGRWQAVVIVNHVDGRLLVLQLEERLTGLRFEDENVGDQAETGPQLDDLEEGRKGTRKEYQTTGYWGK